MTPVSGDIDPAHEVKLCVLKIANWLALPTVYASYPSQSKMTPLKEQFGHRIKSLRLKKELTQEQLAVLCDCTPETISNIERGIYGPRFALLDYLATDCLDR